MNKKIHKKDQIILGADGSTMVNITKKKEDEEKIKKFDAMMSSVPADEMSVKVFRNGKELIEFPIFTLIGVKEGTLQYVGNPNMVDFYFMLRLMTNQYWTLFNGLSEEERILISKECQKIIEKMKESVNK